LIHRIEQCPCQSKKVAATVLAVLLALVSCGDPTSGGPWVVTTAPTATQSGVETRTCTLDSSHKETRTVPATGGGGNFSASGTYTRQNVSGYSVSFYNVANLNYGNCLFSWRGQTYQNATYSVSGSALTIKANEAMSLLFTILSAASIRDPEGELWVK